MESIKKALERAKRERLSAEGHRASSPKIDVKPQAPETTENIRYTQTSIIKTDPAELSKKRVITDLTQDATSAAYKMLRTQVLQRMRQNNWTTLAITSPSSGEGKTLTAINLAISLAMEVNQTILLVDMDLRKPSIHRYFNYQPEKGISDYVLHDTPLSEIMINPSVDRLVILPGTRTFTNSSEMLSSPKFVQLTEELRTRYPSRLVLFDLPPMLTADDAIAFAPYVDAVLLVVEEGKTKTEELKRAKEVFKSVNILGTVLNKADIEHQTYY